MAQESFNLIKRIFKRLDIRVQGLFRRRQPLDALRDDLVSLFRCLIGIRRQPIRDRLDIRRYKVLDFIFIGIDKPIGFFFHKIGLLLGKVIMLRGFAADGIFGRSDFLSHFRQKLVDLLDGGFRLFLDGRRGFVGLVRHRVDRALINHGNGFRQPIQGTLGIVSKQDDLSPQNLCFLNHLVFRRPVGIEILGRQKRFNLAEDTLNAVNQRNDAVADAVNSRIDGFFRRGNGGLNSVLQIVQNGLDARKNILHNDLFDRIVDAFGDANNNHHVLDPRFGHARKIFHRVAGIFRNNLLLVGGDLHGCVRQLVGHARPFGDQFAGRAL